MPRISKVSPSLDSRQLRRLRPGVFSARNLNPPSGRDCDHLLVRGDRTLSWCDAEGNVAGESRFTVAELVGRQVMKYRVFKRSAKAWNQVGRKVTIERGLTEDEARRCALRFNKNRTPSQVRNGTKAEFEQQ